jgi:hypothetical protein
MILPTPAYTATMARVYAQQGYLRKAAQIYRYLIDNEPLQENDPRQSEWPAALADLETQISRQRAPSRKELILLMREWIDLLENIHERNLPKLNF